MTSRSALDGTRGSIKRNSSRNLRRLWKDWAYEISVYSYHHSVPAISRLVATEQCDAIDSIKQDNVLAVVDAVGELHLIARESTMALELSRRIIPNRLDQADTLVEIGTRDECECNQLYTISTLCDNVAASELTRLIPSPMLARFGRCEDLLGLLCCDVQGDGW